MGTLMKLAPKPAAKQEYKPRYGIAQSESWQVRTSVSTITVAIARYQYIHCTVRSTTTSITTVVLTTPSLWQDYIQLEAVQEWNAAYEKERSADAHEQKFLGDKVQLRARPAEKQAAPLCCLQHDSET